LNVEVLFFGDISVQEGISGFRPIEQRLRAPHDHIFTSLPCWKQGVRELAQKRLRMADAAQAREC
jgi:hypothetical protein